MPNTFGHLFRITTWGESHGGGVGVVVDGCPSRIPLDRSRHPGRSRPAPSRPEQNRHAAQGKRHVPDSLRHLRGPHARHAHFHLGPETRTSVPRPTRRWRRSIAPRTPTTPRKPSMASATGRAAVAPRRGRPSDASRAARSRSRSSRNSCRNWKSSPSSRRSMISPPSVPLEKISYAEVESNIVRWPDSADAERVIALIEKVRAAGDSVGGIVDLHRAQRAGRPGRAGL